MINQLTINGVKAVVTYDLDIDLFRGEFVGLNGGADFYAAASGWKVWIISKLPGYS